MLKLGKLFDFKLKGLEPSDRKFVLIIVGLALLFALVITDTYYAEQRVLHQQSVPTVQTQQM